MIIGVPGSDRIVALNKDERGSKGLWEDDMQLGFRSQPEQGGRLGYSAVK